MRKLSLIAVPLAAIGVAGCMETSTLVTVNTDGSGTIAMREYFGPMILGMMESMTSAMEGMAEGMADAAAEGAGVQPAKKPAAPPKAAAKVDFIKQCIDKSAEEMGEGVKLTKSEQGVNANGWKGYKAEYTFTDVTKLRVPKGMKSSGGGGEMSAGSSPSTTYRFEFAKGENPTLKLVPVKDEKKAGEKDAGDGMRISSKTGMSVTTADGTVASKGEAKAEKMDPAMEAQMQQQMLSMMKGMRMAFFVRVNGTVTQTNAKFASPKMAGVFTIFDVTLDEVMKDKDAAKLLAANDPASQAKLAAMDVPGMRAEDPEKTVTISFK